MRNKNKKKTKVVETSISLPKKMSVPSSDLGEYSMLWYGQEKVGKTSLAAQFPDALFLMCEPGGKALSIYQVDVNNWDDFLAYLKLLKKDRRFKTVVVDTVDLCHKYCEDAVCRRLGIDHPSDETWGKGWGAVRDEFAKAMSKLLKLGKGVILISHARTSEFKKKSGLNTHRINPTMGGGARTVIEPMVDIWAYIGYNEDGSRFMQVRGDDEVAAGTRITNRFLDGNIELGGSSAEEAFEKFMEAWNKKGGKKKGVRVKAGKKLRKIKVKRG